MEKQHTVGVATTEAQEEELTVLESIYGDAYVHHTTPCEDSPAHPYQVSVRTAPPGHCTTEPEGICSFPPLVLHFAYTPDYPATAAPVFELRAPWLQSHTPVHRQPYHDLRQHLLQLFQETQGDVVLFTWVEWLKENVFEHINVNPALYPPAVQRQAAPKTSTSKASQSTENDVPQIEIFHGNPLTDRKSKFVAHLARVNSRDDVKQVLKQLKTDKKIAMATHNMYAYRIQQSDKVLLFHAEMEEREDDGEAGAGDKLLYLLDRMKVLNVIMIVTRWYGGIQLGATRFKHITGVAKQLLYDTGVVDPLSLE